MYNTVALGTPLVEQTTSYDRFDEYAHGGTPDGQRDQRSSRSDRKVRLIDGCKAQGPAGGDWSTRAGGRACHLATARAGDQKRNSKKSRRHNPPTTRGRS